MENNDSPKIGCSGNNRTKIIDPNDFYGYGSSSNRPVQNEDFSISVKLSTYRKGRTILTKTEDKSSVQNTNTIRLNFIEGSDINGKKVLTTKYTDLTTVFEQGTINNETLGITNIDIDFNSSYAPQITIDFVDVRGSSIFQNESDISNTDVNNPYAAFFQLPYPLFELEIKGYYGQPVVYCLHMIKFTSKFNSQTGNFEIKCNFIGYTYAMLSDMLVGFLKAIPFTRIGKEKFKNYNDGREKPILNLVELKIKVNQINAAIEKLAINSNSSKILNSFSEGKEIINSILSEYTTFSVIGLAKKSDDESSFRFLVTNNSDFTSDQKQAYDTLDKNVKDYIKKYNDLNITGLKLNESDYLPITYVPDLTIPLLNANSTESINTSITGEELIKFKREALDYVNTYMTFTDTFKFRMYDLRQTIDLLEKEKTKLDTNVETANKELANEIKDEITSELGFDPTVRNMIEIFTGLIEVFIETIYEVSQSAEGNVDRTTELEKVFTDTTNNDIPDTQIKDKKFYPWPDYTEKDMKTESYIEKYLGSSPIIDSKLSIDEIKFIEDLLQAFLTANELENKADALAAGEEINWFPSNPLDTRLFGNEKSPYQRTDLISLEAVQRLMLIRGMTFLGYTNDEKYLTREEIQTMAKLEANAIASAAQPALKNVLKNIKPDTIKDVKGVINGKSRKLISPTPNGYSYTYLFVGTNPNKELRVLPINGDFNDKTIGGSSTKTITAANIDQTVYIPDTSIPTVGTPGAVKTTNYSYIIDNGSYENEETRDFLKELSNNEYFLTNYNSIKVSATQNRKLIDGGTYVKILTPSEFNTTAQLVDTSVKTDSIINLEQLKEGVISQAGFNCFGGTYGIQEFVNMDYGDDNSLKGLPLMYVFYNNNNPYFLGYTRADSVKSQNLPTKTVLNSIYDFKKTGTILLGTDETYPGMLVDIKTNSKSGKLLHDGRAKNRVLFNELVNPDKAKYKISYPYIEHYNNYNVVTNLTITHPTDSISLFGSKWYYLQKNSKIKKNDGNIINGVSGKYTKALLFLNTIPFNLQEYQSPFTNPEIKHLFDIRGGFIHAPRLWSVYVGGLLWWMSTENPDVNSDNKIVGGGRGIEDPIVWTLTCGGDAKYGPTQLNGRFLPKRIGNISQEDTVKNDVMTNLPNQVKEEFKKMFFDFVNGTSDYISFDTLRNNLEIWDDSKTTTQFCGIVDALRDDSDRKVLSNYFTTNLKNYDNYEIISIADESNNALFLELKDDTTAVSNLLTALKEEVIIANTGYRVWRGPLKENFGTDGDELTTLRYPIYASNDNYDDYFKTLTNELTTITSGYTTSSEKDAALNEIFNTANLNDIKLMLYRNCKNIYDKWLGGITNPDNIIFQCGENSVTDSNRNQTDLAMANKYGRTKARLIDSFRFVNRSFRDIGDELFINPLPLMSKLDDFPNTSAYEIISGLLGDNKFDFIALPTFINFHDDKVLETMFKPISMYEEPIKACGPSFVCVYVGQKSKNLDLKDASKNYTNDGFDINCVNGSLNPKIPNDYITPLAQKNSNGGDLTKPYEDPIPVFVVKYGQQNQNLFKDITLDQSEFSESEESIKIVQDISMKGSNTNMTIGGQNMYNVYSVRSYNAEVEMMGNAMIQPMMYFQLDNIPMFHGAYMITRVKHSIKPNNMSTNFTGVRIRSAETPIIDVADAYMALIETLNVAGAGKAGSGTVFGSFPPIVRTIIENGGVNGDVESPNIKLVPVLEIEGVEQDVPEERRKMIAEAVPALTEMLKAFVTFAKAEGYPTIKKKYVGITSLYRSVAYQQELFDKNKKRGGKPGAVAEPGTSNHSWGIAVDLLFAPQKDGTYLKKGAWAPISTSANKEGFDFEYNPSLKWFLDNGYKYGFIIPETLRDKSSVDEYWHFEYHGTSAKCLYDNYPSTYGYVPKLDSEYKPVVVNPKGKDNKIAVYLEKDCNYKYIKSGDGSVGVVNQNMINTLSGDWVARAKTVIKSFEGYLPKAQKDSGTWRGGYGTDNIIKSSGSNPEKVTSFTTFTQIQADLTLEYDVNNRFKKEIIRVLGQQNWDKLNANQKAAIMSYSYNAGAGQLKSKGIVTAITNNDYKKASLEILSGPTTSQGKVLDGLVIRRKTESLIFDKPI
jgi:lysozyme